MTEVTRRSARLEERWEWRTRAACRGTDLGVFLPTVIQLGDVIRAREAQAKAICATCSVINQCLAWAVLVNEPRGVWGGKTADERHGER